MLNYMYPCGSTFKIADNWVFPIIAIAAANASISFSDIRWQAATNGLTFQSSYDEFLTTYSTHQTIKFV